MSGGPRSRLERRAQLLRLLRQHFERSGALEVETPLLVRHPNLDPGIQAMQLSEEPPRWLTPSPEYAMKRLLAAGSGDIYQITRAFRGGERGRQHNPEFTLAEWYRVNRSLEDLIEESLQLLGELFAPSSHALAKPRLMSWQAALVEWAGFDPLAGDLQAAAACCHQYQITEPGECTEAERWDLIFSTVVAPALPTDRLTVITQWPVTDAAAAASTDPRLTQRFEVMFGALELVNGCEELRDREELTRRMQAESVRRGGAAIDPQYVQAAGQLPPCCGAALGVDRVLMAVSGATTVDAVLNFPWEQA